nr:hypothetical protein [Archangium violaceum]
MTISKGLAAVMTATLISYVGVETFWGLVVGFKRLMNEADRAPTFNALRAAGERYGKLMGRNAAQAFGMLALAAIGNTATGLAAKVPKLPGSAQAALQAETQVGFRLAAVGEVETVAVSAETVTIALAPGAVAMTARGTSGDGAQKTDDLPELEQWHEGSYESPLDSLQEHFAKHGAEVGAKDVAQYLRKARAFAQNLRGAQKFPVEGATEGVARYVKKGQYIDRAPDGRIVSFGAR